MKSEKVHYQGMYECDQVHFDLIFFGIPTDLCADFEERSSKRRASHENEGERRPHFQLSASQRKHHDLVNKF